MPFKLVSAAVLKILFTAAMEVDFETLIVISVSDPLGTGTLIPQPPITSFKSGKILVNALAAPVVVGIIDCVAARLRLKSRCYIKEGYYI